MMGLKKVAAVVSIAGLLGAGGVAYAATLTPADIAASLTGKTVDELRVERAAGKTYGTIAKEAGKFDEFKAQMMEQKKAVLEQRVQEGQITQEKADQIITAIEENQATCDGDGQAAIGQKQGAGFGRGNGMGAGKGMRKGNGLGYGDGYAHGRGMGRGMNR